MRIEKAEKLLVRPGQLLCIEIVDDGVIRCVPEDLNNGHYAEIKKLEREGKLEIKERPVGRDRE